MGEAEEEERGCGEKPRSKEVLEQKGGREVSRTQTRERSWKGRRETERGSEALGRKGLVSENTVHLLKEKRQEGRGRGQEGGMCDSFCLQS